MKTIFTLCAMLICSAAIGQTPGDEFLPNSGGDEFLGGITVNDAGVLAKRSPAMVDGLNSVLSDGCGAAYVPATNCGQAAFNCSNTIYATDCGGGFATNCGQNFATNCGNSFASGCGNSFATNCAAATNCGASSSMCSSGMSQGRWQPIIGRRWRQRVAATGYVLNGPLARWLRR